MNDRHAQVSQSNLTHANSLFFKHYSEKTNQEFLNNFCYCNCHQIRVNSM